MAIPEAPTNVRVLDQDDNEHPVECHYVGLDEKGQHKWVATTTWRGLPKGLVADRIPAKTTISVGFEP